MPLLITSSDTQSLCLTKNPFQNNSSLLGWKVLLSQDIYIILTFHFKKKVMSASRRPLLS